MDETIKEFINDHNNIKNYYNHPLNELKLMRALINLDVAGLNKNRDVFVISKVCKDKSDYNLLSYFIRNRLDISEIKLKQFLKYDITEAIALKCAECNSDSCIIKATSLFLSEIAQYNKRASSIIKPIDVIDYMLERKPPEFKSVPNTKFFKNVDTIDLLYVHTILEADIVSLNGVSDDGIIDASYVDLTKKGEQYYVEDLFKFFKSTKNGKNIKINLSETDDIFDEKDMDLRIYKIAIYYKYLIEYERMDILKTLREFLNRTNVINGETIYSLFLRHLMLDRINQLPYGKKTKDGLIKILNYCEHYGMTRTTPFVPINILMYTSDKKGASRITNIISDLMYNYRYLYSHDVWEKYMDSIILNKNNVDEVYYKKIEGKWYDREGVILIHNFEDLLYAEDLNRNLIIKILTNEMEIHKNTVCTIVYGEKTAVKNLLNNHPKLSEMLINVVLEVDDLDIDDLYELLLQRLEKRVSNISDEVKEKIYNYIRATYKQSDTQNYEYLTKLYNIIILNMNNRYPIREKKELKLEDIPNAYNIRDLPEIMQNINALVGLKDIKEQINDLVALLRFNKKANIDIKRFNLHMCFIGNPGTGKTTVARYITEILYNIGYIKQNKLTEVTAKDLIADYVGQTSGKTYNLVKSALGGVLFIDEAYSITSGVGSYGDECIATLIKLMEDYQDRLIVIFAGYKKEMEQFIESNSGLISRIGYRIEFPDYSVDELTEMYLNLLKKNNLTITDEAIEKLRNIILNSSKINNFGNGRYIDNVFQKVLIEHAKNVNKMTNKKKSDYYLITEDDIQFEKLIAENNKKKIGF